MGKYISIGQFNKYYFFILGSISVKFFITFIIGFFPTLTPNKPIFLLGFSPKILSHPVIKNTIQYFGIGLGGLILELFLYKKNNDNEKETKKNEINVSSSITSKSNKSLIYNDIFSKNEKIYFKKIFFVFFAYYFSKTAISSLDSLGFHQVKFWTLEFIAIYYFSRRILRIKIYSHQIISLLITLILSTLLFFINSFIPESNKNCKEGDDECHFLNSNVYQEITDKLYWFFIPIMIFIYLSAMILDAYASVRNKWFMDIKYITIQKIIAFIGIIGFIFSLILLFTLSFISCPIDKKFMRYICNIDYEDTLYYDNFKSLRNIHIDKNFYSEVFVLIPLFLLSSFLSIFFDLLIIKNLDPFYLIPIDTTFYIIYQTIDFILTLPKNNVYNTIRFILASLSDLISVICCSVYLEIIELHFYDLDLNIRRNIILRSKLDINSTELLKRNDTLEEKDD